MFNSGMATAAISENISIIKTVIESLIIITMNNTLGWEKYYIRYVYLPLKSSLQLFTFKYITNGHLYLHYRF